MNVFFVVAFFLLNTASTNSGGTIRERSRCARMIESNAGRKRTGAAAVPAIGPRQVVQGPPRLVLVRPQPLERGIDLAQLEARELDDVFAGGRPVARQVPAHDSERALGSVRQRRTPEEERRRLGCGHVTDRRRPHERQRAECEGDCPAVVGLEHAVTELEQLGTRDRLVRRARGPEIDPPVAHDQGCESAAHVQRRPKRTCLDDRSASEAVRELLLPKAVEPSPERDVRRRRVLRLQRDEPLDRAGGSKPRPLDEQLPGEQGAIQLAEGERLHVTTARTAQS